MGIGSIVGEFIPSLWGADAFSMSSMLFSAVFAIIGIWVGYKIGQGFN